MHEKEAALAVADATANWFVVHCMKAVRDVVRRALGTVVRIPRSLESAVVEGVPNG